MRLLLRLGSTCALMLGTIVGLSCSDGADVTSSSAVSTRQGALSAWTEIDMVSPSYYGTSSAPPSEWTSLQANFPNPAPNSMIIVNKANGPGTAKDNTLHQNIQNLLALNPHMHVLGYINTSATAYYSGWAYMGNTPAINRDIDNWVKWYGDVIDGLFFDAAERLSQPGGQSWDVPQMEYVVQHALFLPNHFFSTVMINAAGAYNTTEFLFKCLVQLSDQIGSNVMVATVEDNESNLGTWAQYFNPGGVLSWVHNYPSWRFVGFVHDAASDGSKVFSDLSAFANFAIGYGFVTDQHEVPNPWEPGPSPAVWTKMKQYTGTSFKWTSADGTNGSYYDVACPPPAPSYLIIP